MREPKVSSRVGNTKFFRDRDEYLKISRFSKKSGFPKEFGFWKRLGTNLNNTLKPSTISKSRRSRTIIRTIPSVISFGLTVFRVSFCTCDKFYIDSVSFLVHILMFGCICYKWSNKPVVFAYLVLNSWWLCVHSIFFLKMFPNRASLYLLPLHDIFCTNSCYHNFTLTIIRPYFLIFIKFTQTLKYTSEFPEFLSDTAQQRT